MSSGSSSSRWSWVGTRRRTAPARGHRVDATVVVQQTGSCPATSERQITCRPATYVDRQRQHPAARSPPSRRGRRGARRQHGPPRQHHALGRPVEPEVSTTTGSGSAATRPASASSSSTVPGTKTTRRTLVGAGRIASVPTTDRRGCCLAEPRCRSPRLSFQSILFAIGEGAFLTGSAVFFTQIVGLTAVQVGLGLTVAGLVVVRRSRSRWARSPTGSGQADLGDRRADRGGAVRSCGRSSTASRSSSR